MNTKKFSAGIIFIAIVLLMVTSSSAFASGTSPVDISHWAYDIVERYATAGYFDGYTLGTKPYTRSDFVNIIMRVDSLSNSGHQISNIDLQLLDKLKTEFKPDLNDIGEWPEIKRDQYHLLNWWGTDYRWFVDPVGKAALLRTETDEPDDSWYSNTSTIGIISRGYFKDDIDFYFYFRDTRIARDDNFTSIDQINIEQEAITSITLEGKEASYDRTYGWLSARTKWLDMAIGRHNLQWGPSGEWGLLLSEYALPFDMVMLQYPGKRVRGTFIAGSLRTDLVDSTLSYDTPAKYRENYKKKYISTHRLEFLPWNNLTIGLSETAIYGERGFDLGYLIPIMFFWSEQHYLGDRDNLLMSFDISYYPVDKLKLYSAFLFDDLYIDKLGSDYWGNRWAIQIGAHCVDPLNLHGLSITAEYVRIEPYVYTHFYQINSYTQLEQFLGYPMQPNSDKILFAADYWFNAKLRINAKFESIRHGANPPGENVGGDILLGHRTGDPDTKEFLGGIEDNTLIMSGSASYEFIPELFIKLGGRYEKNSFDGNENSSYRLIASVSYRYY